MARILDLPVVLVLDCSRLSRSVAAIAPGYRTYDSRIKLARVVLNWVGSDRHLEMVHASYIHIAWGERPDIPARFLQHCVGFNPHRRK